MAISTEFKDINGVPLSDEAVRARVTNVETGLNGAVKYLTVTQDSASNDYGGLLVNLPPRTYLWTARAWWTDYPKGIDTYFYLFTYGAQETTASQGTQVAIDPNSGKIYTRRVKSKQWTAWVCNEYTPPTDDTCVLYSFGDSLTWGAVWDSDESTALYQADESQQMPTRIGKAIGATTVNNNGVSGARFVKQSDSDTSTIIGDVVKATDLSNANIVTIGGGRNDSATSLGDGDTATADDGTICGAMVSILEHLTTTYPKLHIVMYGVTPQPTTDSHESDVIYSRVFGGGWSLATYYTEMAKVCKRYGVQFIDWYNCPLILRWGVLSGGYSSGTQNWSHPLSGDTYQQMGNYLGGCIQYRANR